MNQASSTSPRNALQAGYQLLWYQIRSVLGQGAFGITYLAQDINLKRLVAIKEFLPSQYAMREGNETVRPVSDDVEEKFLWGLRRFIDEARILDQFEHTNIVRIMNIFEANNTAYLVMRYEQGVSLKEILIRQKFLDEADLLNILFPILNGLELIHQAGFIHRDIKPANIFVRTDGTPVLLDFGSARQSLMKDTHTLTSLVSPGYAPIEQYVSKSDKQGAWSDIYGMAATLYRAVTGLPPNDAITRGEALTGEKEDNLIRCRELADKRYSDRFIAAIQHGLEFLTRDRPQSISEWIKEFPELPAPMDNGAELALPGHTSREVVSIVKESLTQTATHINEESSSMPGFWQNERATTSLELAHKEGFHRGLKLALAVLLLVIGGLFMGNIQKIKDVVSPGFVPQQVISTAPGEDNKDGGSVEEIASIGSPLELEPEPDVDAGIQTELQNDPLNQQEHSVETAPLTEEVSLPPELITGPQQLIPHDEDEHANISVKVEIKQDEMQERYNTPKASDNLSTQHEQHTGIPMATTFHDVPSNAIVIDDNSLSVKDPDEGVVFYEDTFDVITTETPIEPPPEAIVQPPYEPQSSLPGNQRGELDKVRHGEAKPFVPTPPVVNQVVDPKVVVNKAQVGSESGVAIEEYSVPVRPKQRDEELATRFRNWLNGVTRQDLESNNEQDKNAKSTKGSDVQHP